MDTAVTSLLLGMLATTSPCILPLYPGFLAYLSGQAESGMGRRRYFLGLFVLSGVLSMMLALGGLIALLAIPTARMLAYIQNSAPNSITALAPSTAQRVCLWFALRSDCAAMFRATGGRNLCSLFHSQRGF